MNGLTVDVVGLRDLQRELRKADALFPKRLREANLKAADLVATETRLSFQSRPGVAPKVAPSVKALAQQRSASVKIGGAAYPYAMGAEFGGGLHRRGNPTSRGGYTTQFPAHRGSGPGAGYSLYPAIYRNQERIVEFYGELVDDLTSLAFPD